MATTDSNGILQLEVSDPVVPLQTALNGIGASVSSAMDSTVRTFKVANATARNNLATQRTPSKSNPLRVWRQDTGVAEINDGTGWKSETPAEPDPNIIRIDGADYQRSGSFVASAANWSSRVTGVYGRTVSGTLPKALPEGWTITCSASSTSGFDIVDTVNMNANRKDFTVRHMRLLNANIASVRIHWQVVKI